MIDPISLAVGGVLIAAGWVMGRTGRPKTTKPTTATGPLVCSCGHGYGSHAEGTQCAAQVERPHYWYSGDRNGYEWVPCPCLTYDGPEPLPRSWTGPLLPPG